MKTRKTISLNYKSFESSKFYFVLYWMQYRQAGGAEPDIHIQIRIKNFFVVLILIFGGIMFYKKTK